MNGGANRMGAGEMDKAFWVRQLDSLATAESLPLTKTEAADLKEFSSPEGGAKFYSVVESLIKRGSRDDAVGLLLEGLEEFPHLIFARATLVRELFERGFFAQAWAQVSEHESDLFQNAVAMRIKLRLQLLVRELSGARQTIRHMQTRSQLDQPSKELIALFLREGLEETLLQLKTSLQDDFGLSKETVDSGEHSLLFTEDDDQQIAGFEETSANDSELLQKLGSMFVSKLENVFCDLGGKLVLASGTKSMAVSETLGNVYLGQSLFLKAQSVFQRLAASEQDSAVKERYLSKVKEIQQVIAQKTRRGESLLHPDDQGNNGGIEELAQLSELRGRSNSIRSLLDKVK